MRDASSAKHARQAYHCLTACTGCSSEAFAYNPGLKGTYANRSKILFVLHRSDSRALSSGGPDAYKQALLESQTGRVLKEMFNRCGFGLDDIYLTNMFKCLLPNDREPRRQEYEKCVSNLEAQVSEFQPRKIVAFGAKPYELMFPELAEENDFTSMLSKVSQYQDVPALISQHPRRIFGYPLKRRNKYYDRLSDFLEQGNEKK